METIRRQLIEIALQRYGDVQSCGGEVTPQECFTRFEGQILFWFNTADGSTRVVSRRDAQAMESSAGRG